MPSYFIYRITQGPSTVVKQLDKLAEHETYKSAKQEVKQLRQDQPAGEKASFKIIFADNELAAEEMLMEKRESPVLQEWEK